ncbi:MAG: acetolactate synthase small subunit [Chloroflexi bacterium]|nr:acetolactate synthase small subunit [Chloroflexota bacterium]|tara:strand:- start:2295 stop:2795 length:501 start_codon:yes stop_codon:yes gene_type:complete
MANVAHEYTVVALVQDRPGVLNRVSSMFRRRGYNIVSLAVGHSEKVGLSRMTFVVDCDDATIDQVRKQLDKLIEVIEVTDMTELASVTRELALIKVASSPETRSEIIQLVDIFRANIVDVTADSVIIEVTGDENKVDSLLTLLEDFGIVEIMRTGRIAIPRGMATP